MTSTAYLTSKEYYTFDLNGTRLITDCQLRVVITAQQYILTSFIIVFLRACYKLVLAIAHDFIPIPHGRKTDTCHAENCSVTRICCLAINISLPHKYKTLTFVFQEYTKSAD